MTFGCRSGQSLGTFQRDLRSVGTDHFEGDEAHPCRARTKIPTVSSPKGICTGLTKTINSIQRLSPAVTLIR